MGGRGGGIFLTDSFGITSVLGDSGGVIFSALFSTTGWKEESDESSAGRISVGITAISLVC